jgi:hypothetical protein
MCKIEVYSPTFSFRNLNNLFVALLRCSYFDAEVMAALNTAFAESRQSANHPN